MNPIKAARLRAGYESANKASKAAGIDQGTYSRLESGKRQPSRTVILKLASVFGATAGQLLGIEPIEPADTPAAS